MSSRARVHCRVLGPARVTVDGVDAPPELLWRKHLALLVYLARSPRRSRTREHLVGLLWSERDERQARHSLSEALRVLRRILGDDQVPADSDQIRLGATAIALDCDQFAERYAQNDWPGAAALVEGDFLEGLSIAGASEFESWLGAERVRWRAQGIDALVRHAAGLLTQGDATAAVTAALRAVTLDPTSEPAARAAMRALALAGDRAGALRVADDLARALREQLGTAPGPDTARLLDRLREARVGRGCWRRRRLRARARRCAAGAPSSRHWRRRGNGPGADGGSCSSSRASPVRARPGSLTSSSPALASMTRRSQWLAPWRPIRRSRGARSRDCSRPASRKPRGSRERRPARSPRSGSSPRTWRRGSVSRVRGLLWPRRCETYSSRRRQSGRSCWRSTTPTGSTPRRLSRSPRWRAIRRGDRCYCCSDSPGAPPSAGAWTTCERASGATWRARSSGSGASTAPRWRRSSPGRSLATTRPRPRGWPAASSGTRRGFRFSPRPCSRPWRVGTSSRRMRPRGRRPNAPWSTRFRTTSRRPRWE